MGISDFYSVIKERCPEQLQVARLTDLAGYRLAVDISVFLYKHIRSAGDDWMNSFIVFLVTLKKSGITSVCIFDGPNPPIEKTLEQERRRAQTTRSIHRLKESRRIRDLLVDEHCPDEIAVTGELRQECHDLIYGSRGKGDTNYNDPYDVLQGLNMTIERLAKQTLPITNKHKDKAEELVKLMGLACVKADGEAEALCSYLAVDGQVDGVLTEDTDVLAYGTPYLFAFKDFKLRDNKIYFIHLPSVLKALEMNYEEFRDLCILLSCDYNNRVVGFPPDGKKRKKPVGIGLKGALAMIDEYRRLETICNYVVDDTPLNYRRCRELFTVPAEVEKINPYQYLADIDEIEAFFKKHGVTIKIEYIIDAWKSIEVHFDTDSEESISVESDSD